MPGRTILALLAGATMVALFGGAIGPVAHGADYTVATATVVIQGVSKQVLTDEKGMTLYYLGTDSPTHSTCTGVCAQVWLPLLSTSAPTSQAPLPGKLAVVKAENGPQVSYNGHLLYRYSGDTAPGQANGEGAAGRWRVASIDLTLMTSSASGPAGRGRDRGEGSSGGGGGMGSGMGMGSH